MNSLHTIYAEKRKSGIPLIGDLVWGTDFCQFFETEDDLYEILVPFFRAGIESNELCIWIIAEPANPEEALKELKKFLPDYNEFADRGQIEVISQRRWCVRGEKTGGLLLSRLDHAILSGFEGLRLAYRVAPELINDVTAVDSRYHTIALFSYSRDKFDAAGLMQTVKNHRFALVRNAGRWELIESSEVGTIKEALKRSEEKLQIIFNNMSEGFAYHRIVLDAAGKPCDYIFYEVNKAFEKLTGLAAENILGERVTNVFPGIEKEPEDWIGRYGQVALTGKPVQFESYLKPFEKWFSFSAFSPHEGYFAVTFGDITERKRAELTQRKLNAELEAANRELESFAYSVSHDLRSPLRGIDGYSKILLEDYKDRLDEDGRFVLGEVRSAAQEMGALIDDLLEYSRLGRCGLKQATVDMNALFKEIFEEFQHTLQHRSLELDLGPLPVVHGDGTLLRSVVRNLVENAVKFTEPRNTAIITVGTCGKPEPSSEFIFFVRDNGVGFDMRYAHKLFGVFQRLHAQGEFQGCGVGLANVKRIIERHGGRVWAEAEPDAGAVFYFTLPRRIQAAPVCRMADLHIKQSP
jgi:signal transduction histidine kinase